MTFVPPTDAPVLIVEGDGDHRLLLQMGLEAVGFDCHVCPDPSSALAWLDRSQARIIVSDWQTPGRWQGAVTQRTDAPLVLLNGRGLDGRLDRAPMALHTLFDSFDRLADRASGAADTGWISPVRVLLVEDNPADAELVAEALHGCPVAQVLEVLPDGEAALKRLALADAIDGEPQPDIILLDVNLPRIGGFAVLDAIKADPRTRSIPVIMLTTSDDPFDMDEAYRRRADGFAVKPFGIDHFMDVVRTLAVFWTDVVTLPGRLD